MAIQEQLDILKQGANVWNEWREEHPDIEIELLNTDLNGAYLEGVDLSFAELDGAHLEGAVLIGADLKGAHLVDAHLEGANLYGAHLVGAKLNGAHLEGANLYAAHLRNVNFVRADLERADLSFTELTNTNFKSVTISQAIITGAALWHTVFVDVDLSTVEGLEAVHHIGPSSIGIDTIIHSHGKIPEIFLRGVGVPPSIIEAIPSLIGSLEPIQYYSCFISYSSKDQDFAERLHADLLAKGVLCWYAPYDLKIGDKWRDRVEESIRLHDKLLLVLSHYSIESPRVEEEVVSAQEKEERYFRETGVERLVLFPICLDEAVKNTSKAWAINLHRLRHIGDFTTWQNHNDYEKAFARLLRDLKEEAQKT